MWVSVAAVAATFAAVVVGSGGGARRVAPGSQATTVTNTVARPSSTGDPSPSVGRDQPVVVGGQADRPAAEASVAQEQMFMPIDVSARIYPPASQPGLASPVAVTTAYLADRVQRVQAMTAGLTTTGSTPGSSAVQDTGLGGPPTYAVGEVTQLPDGEAIVATRWQRSGVSVDGRVAVRQLADGTWVVTAARAGTFDLLELSYTSGRAVVAASTLAWPVKTVAFDPASGEATASMTLHEAGSGSPHVVEADATLFPAERIGVRLWGDGPITFGEWTMQLGWSGSLEPELLAAASDDNPSPAADGTPRQVAAGAVADAVATVSSGSNSVTPTFNLWPMLLDPKATSLTLTDHDGTKTVNVPVSNEGAMSPVESSSPSTLG